MHIQVINTASHYLSHSDSLTTQQQVEAIANHPNDDDFIDDVEGVEVWQKIEYCYTCKQFLKEINYTPRH